MVDSVTNSALHSLLKTQSTGTQAGIAALKSNQKATQAIIEQLQDGLNRAKGSNTLSTTLTSASPPPSSLPRGSLVDIVV